MCGNPSGALLKSGCLSQQIVCVCVCVCVGGVFAPGSGCVRGGALVPMRASWSADQCECASERLGL